MPARGTFTEDRRQMILRALLIGASRNSAAAIAGVPRGTFYRWLARGKDAAEGTRFREFYEACQEAEAGPRMRALGIVYKEMVNDPMLAWKFLERREPGFARGAEPQEELEPELHMTVMDELDARRRRDQSR